MSKRLQIVLPDPVATQLRELAACSGDPFATIAAQMVRGGLALAATGGKARAPRANAIAVGEWDGRARWLEPYGGEPTWRQETWGAIVALHDRYPRHLRDVKTGWWEDESQIETLCALAVWRAEIDEAGQDPREELAFHHQLAAYAHTLRQQGGGVEKTWQPGAPPDGWGHAW